VAQLTAGKVPPSIGFCLRNRLCLRNTKACRDILFRFLGDPDSE